MHFCWKYVLFKPPACSWNLAERGYRLKYTHYDTTFTALSTQDPPLRQLENQNVLKVI